MEHGEWHLRLYDCAWRIEHGGTLIADRSDVLDRHHAAARLLDERSVEAVALTELGALDLTLTVLRRSVLPAAWGAQSKGDVEFAPA